MSLILNIESATDICSINISKNGNIIAEQEIIGNTHSENMTLLIDKCLKMSHLKMSDLHAVAISNGPGSYTSLRIGASTAKGICYALDIPLIAVDTLESLARAAFKELGDAAALYCPMIDARRMEVYAAVYAYSAEKNVLDAIEPMHPKIIDADAFSNYIEKDKKIVLCGNGAPKSQNILPQSNVLFLPIVNSARYLSYISYEYYINKNFVDTAYHTPQYLKAPNITISKKQL